MVGHYQVLLEAVVRDPQAKLKDLPMLTDAERHRLLIEWKRYQGRLP